MDSDQLSLIRADINAQKYIIDQVFSIVEARSQGINPDNLEKLESLAYQIHNFYGAVEELLKIIATHFENNINDTSRWHSLLLKRMTQPIENIRPALLSPKSYDFLNNLRAFRHFFRHAYGVSLNYFQLIDNLDRVMLVKPLLDQEISDFLKYF